MDQIERIMYMEKALDMATGAVSGLRKALEDYRSAGAALQELSAYYTSTQWRQDYDDDCAGKLPSDLKRGVLSEDAVYNLLSEHDQLMGMIRDLVVRENKQSQEEES